MRKWTYESLKAECLIIFECISGSKAYGTSTPASDTDIRYVYVMPLDDLMGLRYPVQVSDETNDCTGYELGRYIELLATANPTVIELLGMPEDVIIHKHPIYNQILAFRDHFITKQLKNSMAGYARQQIQKAKGQDKMMNWEKEEMTRKGPLDFCYVTLEEGGSMPFLKYLENINSELHENFQMTQKDFGVVPVPNARDMYALYSNGNDPTLAPWIYGLVNEAGTSNDLRVVSVPKGVKPLGYLSYNKDGYSMHCKRFKQYEEWLLKRNDARWVDSQNHGQKIDGKNMMHCKRLIDMSKEIASGQGIIVRRPNAEELLKIRRGENVDLQELLNWASAEIEVVDALFDASDLPEAVNDQFRDELLRKMRHSFYRERGWLPALA